MAFDDFLLVLLGALLGIGSSGIFWWIQSHFIVPQIKFSEEIAEYPVGEPLGVFRAKMMNCGRRNIIDVRVTVRVSIYGLSSRPMWTSFDLKHSSESVPILAPGNNKLINLFRPEFGVQPTVQMTQYVRDAIQGVPSLRGLLELGTDASISVYAFGYDEFSGAQKLFMSKYYDAHDIRTGVFDGLNVVGESAFKEGQNSKSDMKSL